jgi:hypothetical protein
LPGHGRTAEVDVLVVNHSGFAQFTPVLNNGLFVVLLGDASASPASNDFELAAQSSA